MDPQIQKLAALMNAAGNAARAVSADNKVRVAQRLSQAIVDLEQQLKAIR